MSDDGAPTRLILEPAQVFILAGSETRYERETIDYRTTDAWGIWAITEGAVQLLSGQDRRRCIAPALIVLEPGGDTRLQVPSAAVFRRLVFAVRWVPRSCAEDHGQPCTSLGVAQPRARDWFGRDLPLLVEGRSRRRGMALIEQCCREWWRGHLRRLRAGARLAAWLYDWVLSLQDGHDAGLLDGLERLVRERLAQGITVTDLATASGMDRSTLYRHFRATDLPTPQRWLEGLRLDQAQALLAEQHTIRDVAHLCGFRSEPAFSRWFRRKVGEPPSTARRHSAP